MSRGIRWQQVLCLCVAFVLDTWLTVAFARSNHESFDTADLDAWVLHGQAEFGQGRSGRGLHLPARSHAEWRPHQSVSSAGGTLMLWVTPFWREPATNSHTFLSFRWSGSDTSYFALSQGWWEPNGARKLYVVLSNQDFAFCHMPGRFDYTLYQPRQWTMLAVTWTAGDPGILRLYVDGRRICERKVRLPDTRTAVAPLFLGSDLGAADRRDRRSEFGVDDVHFSSRSMSDDEVWSAYQRGATDRSRKWLQALLPAERAQKRSREIRLMADEDAHWAASEAEMRRTIDRVAAAGFNVYMPCVWNGGRALFKTTRAPMAAAARDADPLERLLRYAHERGIEVHPWFNLARRAADDLPQEFSDGAPAHAFNIHKAEFRTFIVELVTEAVARYPMDGLNLDYVRSMGPCNDPACVEEYRARYGRAIAEDWEAHLRGQAVPTLAEFNSAAVTDIVRRISAAARRLRPAMPISIDSVPFDHSRRHQGLDESRWLRDGLIDVVFYMSYADPLDIWGMDHAVREMGAERLVFVMRNHEHIGSKFVRRPGVDTAQLVDLVRHRWPNAGLGFYHYPHMDHDQISMLRSRAFKESSLPTWPSQEQHR